MSAPDNNKPDTGRAELLSLERHESLRFHTANNFAFAADWLYVPVHHKEASRLAQQFPILFYALENGEAMPCMLLKSKGRAAIDSAFRWQGGKLPDVMRLYPFGFSQQEKGTLLSVYPHAPHFQGKGERIVTSKGKPTHRLNEIVKQLAPIQKAFDNTKGVMKELLALDVLKPVTFVVSQKEGGSSRITLLACPDSAVIKNQSLSPSVRTLLYIHQQSCRRLFKPASVAAIKTTQEPLKPEGKEASKRAIAETTDVTDLIQSTCQRFGVSLDDLRSRKRSNDIKRAREALAADAQACDCLPELAIQLERSVDTIKKWL